MSIYDPLRDYLKRHEFRELELSFPKIEEIIGRPLPRSADRPQWWANTIAPGSPTQNIAHVFAAAAMEASKRLNEARPPVIDGIAEPVDAKGSKEEAEW